MRWLPEVREERKEDEKLVERECALQWRHRKSVVQECVTELAKRSLLSTWMTANLSLKLDDRPLVEEVCEAVGDWHAYTS